MALARQIDAPPGAEVRRRAVLLRRRAAHRGLRRRGARRSSRKTPSSTETIAALKAAGLAPADRHRRRHRQPRHRRRARRLHRAAGRLLHLHGPPVRRLRPARGRAAPFETSLMIDARVISASHPMLVTVDAGLKAFATEAGAPPILAGARGGQRLPLHGRRARRHRAAAAASRRRSSASASPSPPRTATRPSTSTRPTTWSAATPWKRSGR